MATCQNPAIEIVDSDSGPDRALSQEPIQPRNLMLQGVVVSAVFILTLDSTMLQRAGSSICV